MALSRRANWVEHVNAPQTEAELIALRRCIERGCPFGSEAWSEATVNKLDWKRHCDRGADRKKVPDTCQEPERKGVRMLATAEKEAEGKLKEVLGK